MGGNYQFGRVKNFTDNPFSLPANNYDLDAEWGPSMRDVRHRFFAMVNFGLPKNSAWRCSRRAVRGALQHHHGLRHERRHARQRSPRRRDEKHGARRGAVECESAAEQDVRFRAAGDIGRPRGAAAVVARARRAGRPRWRRRADDDGDGREHAALSHGVLRAGVQPAEPHESEGYIGNVRSQDFGQANVSRPGAAD